MTIATTSCHAQYTANGATVFPVGFPFPTDDSLIVVRRNLAGVESTLLLGSDYTVTGAGTNVGGSITLADALTVGRLSIRRSELITQPTSVRNQAAFFPQVHEDTFDGLTRKVQQLDAIVGTSPGSTRRVLAVGDTDIPGTDAFRALGVPIKDVGSPVDAADAVTKGYTDSANQVLDGRIDDVSNLLDQVAASQGSGYKPYQTLALLQADSPADGTIGVVMNDPDPANNIVLYRAAGVWVTAFDRLVYALGNGSGFQQGVTGARRRDFQDKNRDLVSAADRADPNSANATADLQALLNTGASIFIPSGMNFKANVSLVADGQVIEGPGTITGVTAQPVVQAIGLTSPEVRGLKIVAGPGSSTGILFTGCGGATAIDNEISNHGTDGINFTNCVNGIAAHNDFRSAQINAQFGYPSSSDINIAEASFNICAAQNDMRSGGGYGVQVRANASNVRGGYHRIFGNVVDGYNSYGIMLYRNGPYIYGDTMALQSCIVTNNVVRNISGIRPATPGGSDRTFGAGIYVQGAENCTVCNNTIDSTNTSTTNEQLAPGAIGLASVGRCMVYGNTITNPTLYGIYVNDAVRLGAPNADVDIFDNKVSGAGRSGIKSVMQNNLRIRYNSIYKSAQSGVIVSSDATGASVKGLCIENNHIVNSAQIGVTVNAAISPIIRNNQVDQSAAVLPVLQPVVTGGVVTSVTIASPGSGLGAAPDLTFASSSGSGAIAAATVSGGVVTAVTVTAGGSGYATVPNLIARNGDGQGNGACIDVATSTSPRITGNYAKNSAGRGINLQSSCSGYPSVVDNTIENCSSGGLINLPSEWRNNRQINCNAAATGKVTVQSLPAGPTPSVLLGDTFEIVNATGITNLLDGQIGQQVTLRATLAVTITHSSTAIRLNGSTSFAMAAGNILVLRQFYSNIWDEVGRHA